MLRAAAPALLLCGRAAGHGYVTHPPSRQGGSPAAAGNCLGDPGPCLWFSQPVHIPGKPTLPQKYRSYNVDVDGGDNDWTRTNPWRSPGAAPVYGSGCGSAGGGPKGEGNGGQPPPGYKQGDDSRTIPALKKENWTVWHRGAAEEAMWAINANHGGGYSYRLCKNDGKLSEACFQQTPLRFSGDTQWVQYGADASSRVPIPLLTVSEGTTPAGSQWARVPIPACKQSQYCAVKNAGGQPDDNNQCGGYGVRDKHSCPNNATQFPPPAAGIMGFGGCLLTAGYCNFGTIPGQNSVLPLGFDYNIVDKVEVPADLEAGDYTLSWRWDCEQSSQIWQTCSDITVV